MVHKLYDLAVLHDDAPATVPAHYCQLEVKASACIGCRACESRCPFGVAVAERMQRAAALFEGVTC